MKGDGVPRCYPESALHGVRHDRVLLEQSPIVRDKSKKGCKTQ
jgi:hypothetical protein